MNAAEQNETKHTHQPKPRFVAAECDRNCADPYCPYTHVSGWLGADGVYSTPSAALASLAKAGSRQP